MSPIRTLVLVFLLISAAGANAQSTEAAARQLPSFRVHGGVELPVETERPVFSGLGFNTSLDASVPLWRGFPLQVGGGAGYSYLPLKADNSISVAAVSLGPEFLLEPVPTLQLRPGVQAGAWAGFYNTPTIDPQTQTQDAVQSGTGLFVRAGTDVDFFLNSWLSLGLKAQWAQYLGMGQGVQLGLSARFNLEGLGSQVAVETPPLKPLFPVLAKSFETQGIGTIGVRNGERFEIQDLAVEFRLPGVSGDFTPCWTQAALQPGKSLQVPLKLVLGQQGFRLDKDSRQSAELRVRYRIHGQTVTLLRNLDVQVFNRNAITWDDDRKVAAFIDTKDQDVLTFAKAVSNLVHTAELGSMNENLRLSMAMFEALGQYRLAYARDPNTPGYVESSQNAAAVDFLQYPGQTLRFRGGDCDDLTIVYDSLMEAVGVRTALVTVPGHIYPAVALDVPVANLPKLFPHPERFIVQDGTVWLPLEITLVGKKFSEAWETGAQEWNSAKATGQANLYVVGTSWQTWGSQGSPSYDTGLAPLDLVGLEARYSQTLQRQTSVLIADLTAPLLDANQNKTDDPKVLNRLGIIYATYGLTSQAEAAFSAASRKSPYLPAMTNLASLKVNQGQFDEASALYASVLDKAPNNEIALNGLSRASREVNDQRKVEQYASRLKNLDSTVALAPLPASDGSRASSFENGDRPSWADED